MTSGVAGLTPLIIVAGLSFSASTRAEELPSELLAAARAMPTVEGASGTRRCSEFDIVGEQPPSEHAEPGSDSEHPLYGPDAHGVFLGWTGPGRPAIGIAQALLDAGAAVRLRLTHVRPPATVGRETVQTMDVVLATGPAAAFFEPARPGQLPHTPPVPDGASGPPPDVFGAARLCWTVEAGRVLDWADPREDRPRRTVARVLFHSHLPAWIGDPRVIHALTRPFPQPVLVEDLFFRDDGDGWRADGPSATTAWDDPPRHIVAPEGDVPR